MESKKEKGLLLDELEAVTELHRKSLIRLINGELARKVRQRQRDRTYGVEVEDACPEPGLSLCGAAAFQPSMGGKHLARHQEMSISPGLLAKLGKISVSTVRRILKRVRQGMDRLAHRRKPPGQSRAILRGIPMTRIPWEDPQAGHFEVALVHHRGPSPSG